jgi:hypothetical protein
VSQLGDGLEPRVGSKRRTSALSGFMRGTYHAPRLDQSHDAIFTWKIGGGITYWSRGAELLYGYTAEEAIGRSCRLTRANGDDLLPSLDRHYTCFNATTEQFAHNRRLGTFGLAIGAACALYPAKGAFLLTP